MYALCWAAANTAAKWMPNIALLRGGKPGFWLLHLCVWSIGVNLAGMCGYCEEIPWILSWFSPTGIWKKYIHCVPCKVLCLFFSVGVSENIKEELQNAEISFSALMSLLRFLAFYDGLAVCARMELKYRSCVLICLLSWYVHTWQEKTMPTLIKDNILFSNHARFFFKFQNQPDSVSLGRDGKRRCCSPACCFCSSSSHQPQVMLYQPV